MNLYDPLRKRIHTLLYLDIFTYMPQWSGNKTDLVKFLKQLNTKHLSMKFEYEISKKKIIHKNNKLHTKIFRKKNRPPNLS